MSVFDRIKNLKAEYMEGYRADKSEENSKTALMETLRRNVAEDMAKFPEDAENMKQFLENLLNSISKYTYSVEQGPSGDADGRQMPVDAMTRIYFTDDFMHAYVCAFPPVAEGKGLTQRLLLEDMRYEGIIYGVQGQLIEEMVQKQEYLHIVPVAYGKPAKDGTDGQVKELVARKENLDFDIADGAVNFAEKELVQAIHKDDVICEISKPTRGTQGKDITGRILYGKDGEEAAIPMGKNTKLSVDGRKLLACIDGAVYVENGRFCIKRKQIILGDITISKGGLEYAGDLFIKGDVLSGVTIRATGNVIVEGKVLGATIISGGTIRIQQGMQGYNIGNLKAIRHIQCSVMEEVTADAGGDVYAEVIANSKVNSKGSVFIQGGRGFLIGGEITALGSLTARRIGNLSGCVNHISLGCNSYWKEQIESVKKELDQTSEILRKVVKNVNTLRSAGVLSLEKRDILARLTEQKALYSENEKKLQKRLQMLKSTVSSNSNCSVVCEEIYPLTEISIGDNQIVIESRETDCNIHNSMGRIFLQ